MKIIYNGETIIKIVVRDKRETSRLEYKPFKKRFWGKNKEAGFYGTTFSEGPFTKEDLESGKVEFYYSESMKFIVEDNKAYLFPEVTICYADEHTFTKKFDTFEEAEKWAKEIIDKSIKVPLEFECD